MNIGDFTKKFNDATKDKMGDIIPVVITVYEDRTYQLRPQDPSDLQPHSSRPSAREGVPASPTLTKVGTLTKAQLKDIATRSSQDLNTDNVDAAMKVVASTARQMGVDVGVVTAIVIPRDLSYGSTHRLEIGDVFLFGTSNLINMIVKAIRTRIFEEGQASWGIHSRTYREVA